MSAALRSLGVNVSSKTVGRLLKQLGFSLWVNHKKLCGATSEDRDTQFACIAELRERFAAAGHPIISVDTKKRELVGLFKNGGQAWNREPTLVKEDTKLLIYGLFQKGRVLAQDGEPRYRLLVFPLVGWHAEAVRFEDHPAKHRVSLLGEHFQVADAIRQS